MEFTQGDILQADVEALVNTVNCVGFMGRGIAVQFKRAFPANFRAYEAACWRNEVVPGRMLVVSTGLNTNPRYIINFPTKRHWRANSRIEDIEAGLVALVREIEERGIRSIAIPPLGCGLGGLSWHNVRPLIESALSSVPQVRTVVYEPMKNAPRAEVSTKGEAPKITPGRAVLVGLIDRYLAGLMDPFVSLLEVHKLMYFAQVAGEPLRLTFVKSHYGPYAENLRHVLAAVEGHLLVGYGDGGDSPEKPLELVAGALDDATKFLENHPDTLARFERVASLVDGFESPSGLELLATVHWVATREGAGHDDAIVKAVHAWGPRKRGFTPEQILVTARRLQEEGWIAPLAAEQPSGTLERSV